MPSANSSMSERHGFRKLNMSAPGHIRKCSRRADVFRFTPGSRRSNGHSLRSRLGHIQTSDKTKPRRMAGLLHPLWAEIRLPPHRLCASVATIRQHLEEIASMTKRDAAAEAEAGRRVPVLENVKLLRDQVPFLRKGEDRKTLDSLMLLKFVKFAGPRWTQSRGEPAVRAAEGGTCGPSLQE
jgi:hypothetical protein